MIHLLLLEHLGKDLQSRILDLEDHALDVLNPLLNMLLFDFHQHHVHIIKVFVLELHCDRHLSLRYSESVTCKLVRPIN